MDSEPEKQMALQMNLFWAKYLGGFSGQLTLCWRQSFLAYTIIFSTEVGIRWETTSGPQDVFKVVSQKRFWLHELIDDRFKRVEGILLEVHLE